MCAHYIHKNEELTLPGNHRHFPYPVNDEDASEIRDHFRFPQSKHCEQFPNLWLKITLNDIYETIFLIKKKKKKEDFQ